MKLINDHIRSITNGVDLSAFPQGGQSLADMNKVFNSVALLNLYSTLFNLINGILQTSMLKVLFKRTEVFNPLVPDAH